MSEGPVTTSEIVRYSAELEARSEAFYRTLADCYPEQGDAFAGYARACAKTSAQIRRTYQETVSDALETGYALPGLDVSQYEVDVALTEGTDLGEALAQARALEEKAVALYEDVAERSVSLLATISRAFKRAARTRRRRRDKLG